VAGFAPFMASGLGPTTKLKDAGLPDEVRTASDLPTTDLDLPDGVLFVSDLTCGDSRLAASKGFREPLVLGLAVADLLSAILLLMGLAATGLPFAGLPALVGTPFTVEAFFWGAAFTATPRVGFFATFATAFFGTERALLSRLTFA